MFTPPPSPNKINYITHEYLYLRLYLKSIPVNRQANTYIGLHLIYTRSNNFTNLHYTNLYSMPKKLGLCNTYIAIL